MAREIGRRSVAMLLFVSATFLVGCADRPTTQELTDSILRTEAADDAISLTEAQAACIADELFDSGLGETTLAGLAESFEMPNVLAADVDDIEQAVADAAIACANS